MHFNNKKINKKRKKWHFLLEKQQNFDKKLIFLQKNKNASLYFLMRFFNVIYRDFLNCKKTCLHFYKNFFICYGNYFASMLYYQKGKKWNIEI